MTDLPPTYKCYDLQHYSNMPSSLILPFIKESAATGPMKPAFQIDFYKSTQNKRTKMI